MSSFKHLFKFEYLARGLFFGGLFLIPLFYFPFLRDSFYLPKQILLYLVLGGMALTTFLSVLQTKTWSIRRSVIDIPLLGIMAFAVFSALFSRAPSISFWGYNDTFSLHAVVLILFVFWSWYILQNITTEKMFSSTTAVFLSSGLLAEFCFLLNDIPFIHNFLNFSALNPIDSFQSIFGIYAAILFVLALGILLPRGQKKKVLQILAALVLVTSAVVLVRMDFTLVWGLLAFGSACLFVIGMVFLPSVRKIVLTGNFLFFVAAVLFSLTDILSPLARQLPTELTLSSKLSWHIVEDSFLENTKQFLFGVGGGNFIYTFSEFRPASLNQDPFFWSVRFDSPFNSMFLIMSEFGFLGTLTFSLLILLVCGSVLSAFFHLKQTLKATMQSLFLQPGVLYETKFEYLAFMVAFCMATLGLFFAMYHFAMWFIWWTLLGLSLVSLSHIEPSLMKQKNVTVSIATHHIFAFSFLFLVATGLWVAGGVVYAKKLKAEFVLQNAPGQEYGMKKAMQSDPKYSEYYLLLSKYYLTQAIQNSDSAPDERAQTLAKSIDVASQAKELDPKNVAVWEVLSTAYINSLQLAPGAIRYAFESVETALKLEPTNPIFYWQLGFLHQWNKDLVEAEKNYVQAISLKPDYLQAIFDLAHLFEGQNDLGKAIGVFEKVLSQNLQNPDIYYEIGRLYFNRKSAGDELKAEAMWKKVEAIKPDYSDVLYSLGLLYERRGEQAQAREYFEKVQVLNPENTDIQKKLDRLH